MLAVQLASPKPWDSSFVAGLLVMELLLGILIIDKVPHTEIDWEAHMQEVKMWFDDGIWDCREMHGCTGPLVCPAGFLCLFALLRWITNQGRNVKLAQFVFLDLHLTMQALLLKICTHASRFLAQTESKSQQQSQQAQQLQQAHLIWSWHIAMGLLCCSKRLHSIFMLRLFNEGPTMMLLCLCLHFLIDNHWNSGCCAFSYAVSIKMTECLVVCSRSIAAVDTQ